MESSSRAAEHQRNPELERLLTELNEALVGGTDAHAARYESPTLPVILITGTARSGSTLMLQWLARSGALATPSNLVSRFFRAPAVGAMVERLLSDPALGFRGELDLPETALRPAPYASSLGKTRGPGAPHEFWYFWRHFLGFGDPPALGPDGRERADRAGFRRHLAAFEAVRGRPVALKAMIASFELGWLAELLPTAIFLDLDRDPIDTMRSLLHARVEFFADRDRWYSFRVPGRPELEHLKPEQQVAAQVRLMRAAIEAGLRRIAPSRVIRTDLATFLADPGALWSRLGDCLADRGIPLPHEHPDSAPFPRREAGDPPRAVLEQAWEATADLV